jgi:hemolysin D
MNTNNGNGQHSNSNNGNGTNSNNGNINSSIPSMVSMQQLEQLSADASQTNVIQPKPPSTAHRYVPKFDQPVILKQSRKWSRAILWGLMFTTASTVIWASIAKIEEAVSATGKLEATGATKEIQAPVGGVVKEIYIEDGKTVSRGDKLLSLDPTTAKAQLDSLQKIKASLVLENLFYQSQLRGSSAIDISSLRLPVQMLDLTKSRATLIAENQMYRAELDGNFSNNSLNGDQKERLLSNQTELNARVAAAQLEIDQLARQFNQTEIKLATSQDTLKMNQGILDNITPLMNSGGISKIQYFNQEQQVRNAQSEIGQLVQEKARIKSAIFQAQAKLQSTVAVSRKD